MGRASPRDGTTMRRHGTDLRDHLRLAPYRRDFVLGDMAVAIEAKSSAKITRDHLKGLRSLVIDHPHVARWIVVCREPEVSQNR